MSLATWEEWEAAAWPSWAEAEQARLDRIRVRGYTLATIQIANDAHAELERRVDALLRAREAANEALEELRAALDHAEEMSLAVVEDDDAVNEALARALERLEEVVP